MREFIEKREIEALYHFTNVKNLKSIFEHGLLSRETLKDRGVSYEFNDNVRYDQCQNALCTSIEWPNYKMFCKIRNDCPEKHWAVLRLNAKRILLELDCAYCWTNAGDKSMYEKLLEDRKGSQAFISLFDDKEGFPSRADKPVTADFYPTNPQAEVLVFSPIPIECITAVYFKSDEDLTRYREVVPTGICKSEKDLSVNPMVFSPRNDYEKWKKKEEEQNGN
ncbi:MAG: DUF4433 domain-containing protein [Lachnospiraceae bacterium]|nr:DUF4433 domain-containing protein [Lachnospiraceae bacterium]